MDRRARHSLQRRGAARSTSASSTAGWDVFNAVPTGFVPTQDKQYLVAFAQLPDGASLERTDEVMSPHERHDARNNPACQDAIGFTGLSRSTASPMPRILASCSSA